MRAHAFDAEPDLDDEEPAEAFRPAPGKCARTARLGRQLYRQAIAAARQGVRPLLARAAEDAGAPIPRDLRAELSAVLGVDLDAVRLHTGAASSAAADAVGARAFAIGQDVHFAAGAFDPDGAAGRHLIAHEVAHTVQARGTASATGDADPAISDPADAHEREADAFADAFLAGPRPLDGATRAAIEATTGRALPAIAVTVDRALTTRGRLGEARGTEIHVAPEAANDDALGRHVRLHEAAHVAQTAAADRPRGPVAEVERDAHAIAAAAARGELRPVGVRADAGVAHGLSAGDAAEAAADPEGYLREHYPELADLYDHGLDGLLQRAGDAVGGRLAPLLASTGLDQLGPSLTSLVTSLRPDQLAVGALTGCCECFEHALGGLLASFDGFLAGPAVSTIKSWLAQLQTAETNGLLDLLAGGFDEVRAVLAPILTPIADAAIAVGDTIWKDWVCYYAGLDPNLPPQQALEQKLEQAWTTVTAAFATARTAVMALWNELQQNPWIAYLTRLVGDCTKLVGAVRKVQAARSRDPRVWLAILGKELQGTVFESLIASLQGGADTVTGFAAEVDQFFRRVLAQTGLLAVWNTTVPVIKSAAAALQTFFTAVQGAITAVQTAYHDALARVGAALTALYTAVKPLLDFVVGLGLAIATAPGGLVPFVAGQVFRHLPPCYQLAIIDFILDLFIHAVEALPAIWPPTVLIRAAALGYLRGLRAAPPEQKVGAMTTIMRLVSGDVELAAGFVVGFFEGIWNSSLGLVVQLCLPILDLIPQLTQFASDLAGYVKAPFEALYQTAQWFIDLAATIEPIDGPGQPAGETPAPDAPAPAPAEPAPDDGGGFTAPPAFPGFPFDLRAAFDKLLHGGGITRADLEKFLTGLDMQLEALGQQIGGDVAAKVLVALNDDGAPYHVGEVVGEVAGWACGELVVMIGTWGLGGVVEAGVDGAELLANLIKNFPKVVELLGKLRKWLEPVVEFVEHLIAEAKAALRAIMKWLEELMVWAEEQLDRAIVWLEKKLGVELRAPKPGLGEEPGLGGEEPGLGGEEPGAKQPGDGEDEGGDKKPGGDDGEQEPDGDDSPDAGAITKAAAKAAWTYLTKHLDQDAVHTRAEVERALAASHEDGEDGVTVTLGLDVSGDSWSVSADAAGSLAATYGDGWAQTVWAHGGETSTIEYGFHDDAALHDRILADAATMIADFALEGDDTAAQYESLRRFLDGPVRDAVMDRITLDGVEFVYELEDERNVEADHEASITLVITPNAKKKTVEKEVDGDEDGGDGGGDPEAERKKAEAALLGLDGTQTAALAWVSAEQAWVQQMLGKDLGNDEKKSVYAHKAKVEDYQRNVGGNTDLIQRLRKRYDEAVSEMNDAEMRQLVIEEFQAVTKEANDLRATVERLPRPVRPSVEDPDDDDGVLRNMRFQVQWDTGDGKNAAYFEAHRSTTSKRGVTVAAAQAGILEAWEKVVPAKAKDCAVRARDAQYAWVAARPPEGLVLQNNSHSEMFNDLYPTNKNDARVDVENMRGHNLRYQE